MMLIRQAQTPHQRRSIGDNNGVAEDEVVPEGWRGGLDQVLASLFFTHAQNGGGLLFGRRLIFWGC